MFENLRALGIVACLVSTVMFMAGALTDHWVDSDNGHWGLWEICDESEHNTTLNSTLASVDTISTTTSRFNLHGFVAPTTKPKEDEKKKKEEEDSCFPLSITSLPAFMHVVRTIIVLSAIVLVWGVLSGRSLHWKVPRGDTFFQMHKSESLGLVACLGSLLGILLFADNYKSVSEETFTNSSLDWSYFLVRFSVFFYFPAAIFMMAPTLRDKCGQGCSLDDCLNSLCIRIRFPKRRRSHNSTDNSLRRAEIRITRNRDNRETNNIASVVELEGGHFDQLSETDSDIFTVTMRTNDDSALSINGSIQPSTASDLPQYEDLAPPNAAAELPPPPSYDDVVSGGYLAFAPTAPPPPPFVPPSSSLADTGPTSTIGPPPAYQSSFA